MLERVLLLLLVSMSAPIAMAFDETMSNYLFNFSVATFAAYCRNLSFAPGAAVGCDACALCQEAHRENCFAQDREQCTSPDPNSRAPPGRWADGAVRCQHALCRDCDLGVQRASRDVRRRCPECRRARRSVIAAPP